MLYEPTCEICGSHIEDDRCEVCEHTGDNGDWVEEVIKKKEDDNKKRRRTFYGEEDYRFPLNLLKEGVNRMRNTQLIVKN